MSDETSTIVSRIMSMDHGQTKKGSDCLKIRLADLEEIVWAFGYGIKNADKFTQGDEVSLELTNKGTSDKPFYWLKKISKAGSAPRSDTASRGVTPSQGGSGSSHSKPSFDDSRNTMMVFSYLKDLHEQFLKAGTVKDPVKAAIKAGSSLYEGAKAIVHPPVVPEGKKASSAQEGRIRSMADTIGLDTEEESWKKYIKTKYGVLSSKDATELIDLLQKTIDGKMGMKWTPDEQILFYVKEEEVVSNQ